MSSPRNSKLGTACSVFECSVRSDTNLLSTVKMYCFLASPSRRLQWEIALQRKNWKANSKSVFCNKHFITDNLVALHFKYDQARRRFVEWARNEISVVLDFHKRILFSDEAHFWLNGYVNKQNCRIWSEANPQVYVETPLHPEKLTVWCALWAGGILLQKR
ncbi:uncharacterized protein TNCV_3238261 [Trichonephila clavipes]|nr:uncharacterized protein TNCV_3238261 [Trichonephila clavipes]